MIEKLKDFKRIGEDFYVAIPSPIEIKDKINEIIDVINEKLLNEEEE